MGWPAIDADWSAAIDDAAGALLRAAGISRPPVQPLAIARRLGIVVARDDRQAGRARYLRLDAGDDAGPRPSIMLRSDPRAERTAWAVAHELGEHLAGEVFARLEIDEREIQPGWREQAANLFAARLLLPSRWFHASAERCDWDLARLKRRFATASHELIARRMLDFDRPALISIFDQGQLYFRRGVPAATSTRLLPEELACQRRAHARGRIVRRRWPHVKVRVWPVHEEGWKREIMQTEPGEELLE